MSQKNHKMTDGKLLQTDKKYAQLKLKQKEKIAEWMFQVTRDYYKKNGSIIFFVGLTLPRYRFSKPSASLDMNLR